jgi:hypothetical protein
MTTAPATALRSDPCTMALQCYFFGPRIDRITRIFSPFFLIRDIRAIRGQTTNTTTGLQDLAAGFGI